MPSSIRKFLVFLRRKSFPLRPTLVTSVIVIILLTIASVGIPSYLSSKKSIRLLWEKLGENVANRSIEYITGYLHDAPKSVDLITDLYDRKEFDINDVFQVMDISYEVLHDNINNVWFSFAKMDGSYYGAYRDPQTGEIKGRWSVIQEGRSLSRDFKLENGAWVQEKEFFEDYDPRTREWWKLGSEHPDGIWTNPYVFYDAPRRVGVTFAQGQKQDGKIIGFWAVDYQTDFLSDYLKGIVQGTSGRILVISDQGIVIADSRSERGTITKPIQEVYSREDWAYKTWETAQNLHKDKEAFEVGEIFAFIQSFSPVPTMRWHVISMVDKSDYFGPIYHAIELAILIALPLCIFFIILAAVFFGRISQRLKEIALEMNQVGSLRFTPTLFSNKPSLVREINMMNSSLDRMKIGLNSFSKYVPKDLVFELIRSGQAAMLGGKKAEITLLFSDLANFTKLSEELPADEMVEILGEYLGVMSETIQSCHGVVDQYIGDSIFALWGAPEPLPTHALQACKAALAMREKFKTLWVKIPQEHKSFLKQRIGINTGKVIVGNIGSPDRLSYGAVGDAVNLASRLEGLNKFYMTTILVGEETARLVKDQMVMRPIDWVAVKGRAQTTLIHELIGEKGAVAEKVLEAMAIYQRALDLYKNREFLKAAETFDQANALFGGQDFASQKLAERSRSFHNTPPPQDWNGATVMQEK